jgi:hypothetical protein
MYERVPPLVNGRVGWDNWLVWKARSVGAMVVDASAVVKAVHQDHDYSYHPAGIAGVWSDELAKRNIELAGGWWHLFTIENAQFRLGKEGVKQDYRYLFADLKAVKRALGSLLWSAWVAVLGVTRPIRHRVGLRQGFLKKLAQKLT